jgi:hypothetical protein
LGDLVDFPDKPELLPYTTNAKDCWGNYLIERKANASLIFTSFPRLANLGFHVGQLFFLHHKRSRCSLLPSELQWLSRQIRSLLHWHLASFLCISAGSLLALLAEHPPQIDFTRVGFGYRRQKQMPHIAALNFSPGE